MRPSRLSTFPLLASLFIAGHCSAGDFSAASDEASLFTANVGAVSQYVSRGIRQSWGRPAVQAGLDYASPRGWSAGAWASTIDGRFVENGSMELDLYAGYAGTLGPLGYNATLTWYKYPGARVSATGTSYDYGEVQAGLSWKSLYAKYNYTFSRDFFGIQDARGTGYLDVGANHELGHALALQLHAGDGRVAGAGNGIWDWRDLRAGLSKKLEGGWVAALNVTRAFGGAGVYDRYTTGVPRGDGRPAFSNVARRALVLSLTRTY